MGRALWACLHGDIGAAYSVHPLGPFVFASLGVFVAARSAAAVSPRARNTLRALTGAAVASPLWQLALAITIGVWLARFGGAFGGPAEVTPPWRALALTPEFGSVEPNSECSSPTGR